MKYDRVVINLNDKAMETGQKVFNLILLDESGSMESIREATIGGFNEVVQTIRNVQTNFPEQQHSISLVTFNGNGIKTVLFDDPVENLGQIDREKYRPDSNTPLYDAMGFSLLKMKRRVENEPQYNVLVTVLTDGYENSSREYSASAIRKLVEELSAGNWTFTYIGANHDVEKAAMSISVTNTLHFEADSKGMAEMLTREKKARYMYSQKLRDKSDFKRDFYRDGENGKS